MKVDLSTIDKLRERIDLTYEEAAAYLEAAGGDLVEALVMAERDMGAWEGETDGAVCPAWRERIARIVKQSSSMRLIVERDGDRLANLPVAAGLVGVIWAPELAALGAIAALASRCSVRLERC